jgi:hypothetical protein
MVRSHDATSHGDQITPIPASVLSEAVLLIGGLLVVSYVPMNDLPTGTVISFDFIRHVLLHSMLYASARNHCLQGGTLVEYVYLSPTLIQN